MRPLFYRGNMTHIVWKIQNNATQCAVPRCNNRIGPGYLGIDICWRCFDRHCDKPFLQRYTSGAFSKIYVAGRYFRHGTLLVRTSEMSFIKLGDKVKMDPENCGAYSQFLKKGDGVIIGIHPMGRKDLGKTVRKWPLKDVGHLTIKCDNGLVIIIGPSRLVEINGFKRPDEREVPTAVKRKGEGIRIGPRRKRIPQKSLKKRRPMKRSLLDDLWG